MKRLGNAPIHQAFKIKGFSVDEFTPSVLVLASPLENISFFGELELVGVVRLFLVEVIILDLGCRLGTSAFSTFVAHGFSPGTCNRPKNR